MRGVNIEDFEKYSDEKLIDHISKNDVFSEIAFNEIYKRYSKRIFAFCKNQTSNSEYSKSAFQEAWITLFNYCNQGKKVNNISAFLVTIARRKIIDFIRKENTTPVYLEFDEDKIGFQIDQKTEIIDSIGSLLEKGLLILKDELREAFILKRINRLEYKEIAEITGFSVDCLKKRVSRAKDFLKKYIQENLEK